MIVKIVPQQSLLRNETGSSINLLGYPHIWGAIMGHLWDNPQRRTFATLRQVNSELQVLAEQKLYEHVAITFVRIKPTPPPSPSFGSPPSASKHRRATLRAAKGDAEQPTATIEIRHPDGGRRIPGLRWGRDLQDDHELCLMRLQEHVRVGIDVVTAGFDGPIVLSKEDEADLVCVFEHQFDHSVETPPFMRVHGTGAPECLIKLRARKFVQFIEPRGNGSSHQVMPYRHKGQLAGEWYRDEYLPPLSTFYLLPNTVETLVIVWRGRTDLDSLQDPVLLPGQAELPGLREVIISVQRTTGGHVSSRVQKGNSGTLLLDLDEHLSLHMRDVPHTVLGLEHIAEQWVGLNPEDSSMDAEARQERVWSKIKNQCISQSSLWLFDARTSWPSYADYYAELGLHRFAQLLGLPGERYQRACERILKPREIHFEPPVPRWQTLPSVRDEHPEPRLRKRR